MYSTAVVSLPISMHWDGSVWTAVDVPVPPFCTQRTYLTDVAAARPKLVLATGYCTTAAGDQGFVLRWDGRAWSVAAGPDQIPAPSALNGLTFKSGTEAWAVGTAGGQAFILHWDGTAWAAVDAPADVGPDSSLTSIDSSRTRLWAVGLGQSSQPPFAGRLTARWDGTAWEWVPAGDFGSFNGVSVVGNKTWAVGQNIDHSLIMWPEQALALLVDHQAALGERTVDGVIERGETVGADEPVLLAHPVDDLRDDSRRLILARLLERRRLDQEAIVLDLFGDGRGGGRAMLVLAAPSAEQRFEE
jgi:hypothetical protein